MQVVVADFDVIESGFRIVVFDEIMLNVGLASVREKIFPVDGALVHVGYASVVSDILAYSALVAAIGAGVLHSIFYVNEREAPRIFFEIGQRIFVGDANPAEV